MNCASPRSKSVKPDPLAAARERFVACMGDHLEGEGLPRIAGRLMGLLIFEAEPISFGDLANRLGVSRASISTNARLLESKGIIERVCVPGERQDHFRLTESPYVNIIRGVVERMEATRREVKIALETLPPEAGLQRRRLEDARRFYDITIQNLSTLTQRLCAPAESETADGR